MNPHRIHVLHAADGDGCIHRVAKHLELDLLPAQQAALHQHLADGADLQAVRDPFSRLGEGECEAAAPTSERERRTDHHRLTEGLREGQTLVEGLDDHRLGNRLADARDQVPETAAILGGANRCQRSSEDPNAIPIEDAGVVERDGQVQPGLASQRRQQAVGPMARDDPGEVVDCERTDDHRAGHVRIGHHRRGVRVDQHGLDALSPERETRLHPGVVELGSLTDDDRPGADHQDAPGRAHARAMWSVAPSPSNAPAVAISKMRAASMGPGAPSGWNWTEAILPEAWTRPSTVPSFRSRWLTR